MLWKLLIMCFYFYLLLSDCRNCQELRISNLDNNCMYCLCVAATSCNRTLGCQDGYCGPFKISRVYWKDAGEVTLPDDDKNRAGAYEDCAISYECARRIVVGYMVKYGRDCNGDKVTDCEDFSKINFNGGFQCQPDLMRNEFGIAWNERFHLCMPSY